MAPRLEMQSAVVIDLKDIDPEPVGWYSLERLIRAFYSDNPGDHHKLRHEIPPEWQTPGDKPRAEAAEILLRLDALFGVVLRLPFLVNEPHIARHLGVDPDALRDALDIEARAQAIMDANPPHPELVEWRRKRRASREYAEALFLRDAIRAKTKEMGELTALAREIVRIATRAIGGTEVPPPPAQIVVDARLLARLEDAQSKRSRSAASIGVAAKNAETPSSPPSSMA